MPFQIKISLICLFLLAGCQVQPGDYDKDHYLGCYATVRGSRLLLDKGGVATVPGIERKLRWTLVYTKDGPTVEVSPSILIRSSFQPTERIVEDGQSSRLLFTKLRSHGHTLELFDQDTSEIVWITQHSCR